MTKFLFAAVLIAMPWAPALAGTAWEPLSNTAMAITGTIELSEDKVSFENGVVMPLEKVAGQAGKRVYRVLSNRSAKLLNGNTLCSVKPAAATQTFLEIQESGDDLSLRVFEAEQQLDSKNMCATYAFIKAGQ